MLLTRLLFLALTVSQAWLITVLFSPASPTYLQLSFSSDLMNALTNLNSYAQVRIQSRLIEDLRKFDWDGITTSDVLVDASFNALYSLQIRTIAEDYQTPDIVVWAWDRDFNGSSMIPAHPSVVTQAKALIGLFHYYNWTSISLLTSPHAESLSAAQFLDSTMTTTVFPLPDDIGQEALDSLMSKEVKVWCSSIIICMADFTACVAAVQDANAHDMMREGYAIVLTGPPLLMTPKTVPGNETIGLLYLVEPGTAEATTVSQYHAYRVAYWITLIIGSEGDSVYRSKADLLTFLAELPIETARFELWNKLETSAMLVGDVDESGCNVKGKVVFPGNSSQVPVVKKPMVEFSIDNDLTNPTQPPNNPYADYFLASVQAFTEIASRADVLSTHDLVWNNVTYGSTEFEPSYVTERLEKHKDMLGVAHMAAIGSGVAMGASQVLASLGISLPMIGSSNSNVALSNSTAFPYYVRTIVSNGYGATVYMTMFRYFGWKRINVLYGNESYGIDFYNNIVALAESYNIEIVNKADLRIIDPYVTNATIGKYRENLQEIVNSNVRPLLCGLLLPAPTYVFQGLYDLGARAGDIIYFGDLSADMFTNLPLPNATKSLEIGLGGIQLTSATYFTDIGVAAFTAFVKEYGHNPIADACFFYDSAYALVYTLKYLIYNGKNYEDPVVFMKSLREIQFQGCSGIVAFESGSNDRSFPGYVVVNIKGNVQNLELLQVGFYTPTSVKVFNFNRAIVWPGQSNSTPTDVIVSELNCPFRARDLHYFPGGELVTSLTCVFITVVIAVLSFVIWLKFWKMKIHPMRKKEFISVDDFLLMTAVVLEAFQYSAFGPDFSIVFSLLLKVSQALSLDLDNLVTLSNGVYWTMLDVIIAVCVIWVLLLVYIYLHLDEKCMHIFCIGNLSWISWYMLPYVGNLCFLPIISVLLDVLVCNQGVGVVVDDITYADLILDKDCNVYCWQGAHIYYVTFSILALLLYAPLAVLLRPLWQEFQGALHIKTSPTHFLVKTIFQMLIIGLSKSLRQAQALCHGVIYLCLLLAFLIIEIKIPGFNYERLAHWHRVSLVCVLWVGCLALISQSYEWNPALWTMVLLFGWTVIIGKRYSAYGLFRMVRSYPSMLIREQGVSSAALFRFAFTFKKTEETTKTLAALNQRQRKRPSDQPLEDSGSDERI